MQNQLLRKMDILTGKMQWRKRKDFKSNAMEEKEDFKSTNRLIPVARYVTTPATVIGDIGDLLSEGHAL